MPIGPLTVSKLPKKNLSKVAGGCSESELSRLATKILEQEDKAWTSRGIESVSSSSFVTVLTISMAFKINAEQTRKLREKLEKAEQTTRVFARPNHFAHLSDSPFVQQGLLSNRMTEDTASTNERETERDTLRNDAAKKPSPLQLLLQLKQRVSDVQFHPYQVANAHWRRSGAQGATPLAPTFSSLLSRLPSAASSVSEEGVGLHEEQRAHQAALRLQKTERYQAQAYAAAVEAARWRGEEALRLHREVSTSKEHVAIKEILDKGPRGGLSGEYIERRRKLILKVENNVPHNPTFP